MVCIACNLDATTAAFGCQYEVVSIPIMDKYSPSLTAILQIQVGDDQPKNDSRKTDGHEMILGFPVHAALNSLAWLRFLENQMTRFFGDLD